MQEETCHNHIRVYLVVIVCDVVHFVQRSDMCCRVTYRCPTVIDDLHCHLRTALLYICRMQYVLYLEMYEVLICVTRFNMA